MDKLFIRGSHFSEKSHTELQGARYVIILGLKKMKSTILYNSRGLFWFITTVGEISVQALLTNGNRAVTCILFCISVTFCDHV